MSEPRDKQYRQFFTSTLSSELQKAMTQATGSTWNVAESDKPGSGLSATPQALYRMVLKGDVNGACYLQFAAEEVQVLTAQIAQKTPAAAAGDALLGMLENAVTEFMLALIAEYGEVEVNIEPATALGGGNMDVVPFRASSGTALVSMVLYVEPGLADSIAKKAQAVEASAAMEPQPSAQSMESLSQRTGIDESKLKLILDVELNLLLRFGQRHLTLREILELNSGSVIELDRQVDEPIELLLDGRVIARGEAVVVDGNYGLRVTEVPQPMASQLTH